MNHSAAARSFSKPSLPEHMGRSRTLAEASRYATALKT